MKDYNFTIKLPETFSKAATIEFPKFIPVFKNLDHSKLIAEATCRHQDNLIFVTIPQASIPNVLITNLIGHEIAGTIIEQSEQIITKFKLESVSLIPKTK